MPEPTLARTVVGYSRPQRLLELRLIDEELEHLEAIDRNHRYPLQHPSVQLRVVLDVQALQHERCP
jgi:hypothetical protein